MRFWRLRKDAVFLFGLALAINAGLTLRLIVTRDLISAYSQAMQVSVAYLEGTVMGNFGWLVMIAVCAYGRSPRQRGVLH
jgi:hypothetical protein